MRSIFEDEDDLDTGLLTRVGPRDQPIPERSITVGTITGFTRIEGAGKTTRKRTKAEALERIQSLPSFAFLEESAAYGAPLASVARALRKPLIIYEASKLGAMGLILIDPLDRLE
jgi:hypothetical protein